VHGEGHCERPSKRVIRSVLDWTGLLLLKTLFIQLYSVLIMCILVLSDVM
jgi:hypothetical protein